MIVDKEILLALLSNPKCFHPAGSDNDKAQRLTALRKDAIGIALALEAAEAQQPEVGDDGPVDHDTPGG